jgi:hypothetical protein
MRIGIWAAPRSRQSRSTTAALSWCVIACPPPDGDYQATLDAVADLVAFIERETGQRAAASDGSNAICGQRRACLLPWSGLN